MAETSKQAEFPILIIGAGCSGLALAHGLHLKDIPYKLFERDSSFVSRNGRDWGMACHWAIPGLKVLIGEEKWSRLNESFVDPHLPLNDVDHIPMLNGATGEQVNNLPIPNFHRFLRSRLRTYIASNGGVDVSFGKKLERIEYADDGTSVTAHFEDGTAETGRLLVGADGSQSRVRSLLFGPEVGALKKLPLAATFITASFPREQALRYRSKVHPVMHAYIHPQDMLGMLSTLDAEDPDPEQWRFASYVSWPCSIEEQTRDRARSTREKLAQAREKAQAFTPYLRSFYDSLREDIQEVYYTTSANWDPSVPGHEWDTHGGRVTLVGDAAHPMTYHRGQGLNHSLMDVYKLFELLINPEGRSQAELIKVYEDEMRVRGGAEVQLSEKNSLMLHNWEVASKSPLIQRGVAFGSSGNTKPDGDSSETKVAA
ncbi:FAD/NAD(P)-binding domain-containing protein [Hypomontagnella monticulosa]|nr:FAD/NAD(P)-binding domain-containing protein [Hypomontagnella monticulosa]